MRQGTCSGCKRYRWINIATSCGQVIGEYCEDCFEDLEHDPVSRNRTNSGSGRNHNDPGFDNVIRALEEDR